MNQKDQLQKDAAEYCKDIFKDVPCPAVHSLTLDVETATNVYTEIFIAGHANAIRRLSEGVEGFREYDIPISVDDPGFYAFLEGKIPQKTRFIEKAALISERAKNAVLSERVAELEAMLAKARHLFEVKVHNEQRGEYDSRISTTEIDRRMDEYDSQLNEKKG